MSLHRVQRWFGALRRPCCDVTGDGNDYAGGGSWRGRSNVHKLRNSTQTRPFDGSQRCPRWTRGCHRGWRCRHSSVCRHHWRGCWYSGGSERHRPRPPSARRPGRGDFSTPCLRHLGNTRCRYVCPGQELRHPAYGGGGNSLEIAVNEDFVERTIDAIIEGARTGAIGDGKIFVTDLVECIRIRTGERGHEAIG